MKQKILRHYVISLWYNGFVKKKKASKKIFKIIEGYYTLINTNVKYLIT